MPSLCHSFTERPSQEVFSKQDFLWLPLLYINNLRLQRKSIIPNKKWNQLYENRDLITALLQFLILIKVCNIDIIMLCKNH